MQSKIKKLNIFEYIYLIGSFLAITTCFFVGKDRNYFSLITSFLGAVAVLTISKGLFFAPILNAAFDFLYGIISITQGYYGEAIICFVLMMPIYVFSMISWYKNRKEDNSKEVKINKITKKEFYLIVLTTLCASFIFYFILKALNTNQLIISTASVITAAVAAYLMFRRCSYYALIYIINDIILIIMWSLDVVSATTEYLPILINFIIFLINDIYGFVRWKKEEKIQNNITNNKEKN